MLENTSVLVCRTDPLPQNANLVKIEKLTAWNRLVSTFIPSHFKTRLTNRKSGTFHVFIGMALIDAACKGISAIDGAQRAGAST